MPVTEVCAGQAAAFALKKVKRKDLRKGTVLLGTDLESPKAVWEFKGEVVILHHPTTIMTNYQVICASFILALTVLKSGDGARRSSASNCPNY